MKILVLKLGALGDVINSIPLVIMLKKQLDAQIHWIVEPLSYPILAAHSAVDEPIRFDCRKDGKNISTLFKRLRSKRFDLVLDLQRIAKSALLGTLARGERKIGFDKSRCKELTWLLPLERIRPSDPQRHMVDQYLEFGSHLGVQLGQVQWNIYKQSHRPRPFPFPYVVLNVGASKPANRWTAEGFAGLSDMIWRYWDLVCVLTGGAEDVPMANRIQAAAKGRVLNLVGKTSLRVLVDVIAAAETVVSCDTGPMHLAVALRKKVVGLFGPSDYRRTGPYKGGVIRANLPCGPCNRKTCATPICMRAIRPEHVFRLINGELQGSLPLSMESEDKVCIVYRSMPEVI